MIGPYPMDLERLEAKAVYVATVYGDDGRIHRQRARMSEVSLFGLGWITYQMALPELSTSSASPSIGAG